MAGSLLVGCCRLLTGINSRWIGVEPNAKSRIYYANHSSHLDGLVIWASLPASLRHHVHPVAARDYWDSSRLRRYLAGSVFNAVLIDRQSRGMGKIDLLGPMKQLLAQGESLILFPEGTRGNGETIAEFKGGLYQLLRDCPDTEVVPVYLENLNRVLPKGSRLVVPVICSATFGTPLAPLSELETKVEFLHRARQALEALAS
ncbi:MAG: lysophospholipid acyltransferase family protein [Enterobacteriaceae bacterium]